MVAVPPVLSAADSAAHGENKHHQSNYSVAQWHELFAGWSVSFYSHHCAVPLNFSSFAPSRVTTSDFEFRKEGSIEAAYIDPPITAVYVLEGLR